MPLSHLIIAMMSLTVACGTADPASPTDEAPAPEAVPGPARIPAAAPAAAQPLDAPDMAAALTASFEHGVVAPPAGGSTWQVDPFVVAWVTSAVQANGDRWLTRYNAVGADGVEVSGWQVRVPSASPLADLGLRDGDVVEEVARVPAGDVEGVTTAVSRAENHIALTVYREDVSITLGFRIEPGLIWANTRKALSGGPTATDGSHPFRDRLQDGPGATPDGPPSQPGGDVEVVRPSSRPAGRPSSGASSRPSPSTPSSNPKPRGPSQVSCSSGSVCTVDKAYFNSMVNNPARLNSQAGVVPAIRNDVHSGYKLKWVKSGSAVHALGFRSGDKVTHVNGADLTDDLAALGVYASIGSTRRFNVRYVRGGSTRTKTIHIR